MLVTIIIQIPFDLSQADSNQGALTSSWLMSLKGKRTLIR